MSKNSNSPTQNDFEKNIRAAIGEYLNPKGDASKDRTMFRGAKLPEETLVDKITTLLKQQTTQDSQLTLVSKKIDGNLSIVNRVLDEMLFDKTEDINKIKQSLQQKGFDIQGVTIPGKIRGSVGDELFSTLALDTKDKKIAVQEAIQKACDEICSKTELLQITLKSLENAKFSNQSDALESYKKNLAAIRYDFSKQDYKGDFLKTLTETASSMLDSAYRIKLTEGLDLDLVSKKLEGFPEAIQKLLQAELERDPINPGSWTDVYDGNAGGDVNKRSLRVDLERVDSNPRVTEGLNLFEFNMPKSASFDSLNEDGTTKKGGETINVTHRSNHDPEKDSGAKKGFVARLTESATTKLQDILYKGKKNNREGGFANEVSSKLSNTAKHEDQSR